MGRLELRQGNAAGILAAAFKVCFSVRTIFLLILLLSVAYEAAIERYAFTVTTGDGKTTLQFARDPKSEQPQPQENQEEDSSFLSRLFRFSITIPELGKPEPDKPPAIETETDDIDRDPPRHADIDGSGTNSAGQPDSGTGSESRGADEHSRENAVEIEGEPGENAASDEKVQREEPETRETEENRLPEESETRENDDQAQPEESETRKNDEESEARTRENPEDATEEQAEKTGLPEKAAKSGGLPALKIKYAGNGTTSAAAEPFDDANVGVFASRFRGRRGLDRTTEPSMALGLLLLAFLALLFLLAVVFFLVCFNQSVVPAVLGYAVITAVMGKPVNLRRSLVSGFRVGISRLMWLSFIFAVSRGAQSLVCSRIILRDADDVDSLLVRLSTMPFAFVRLFRDEKIVQLGITGQVAAYLAVEYLFEAVAYAVFIVACWVTIVERNYRGMSALRRSWDLIGALPEAAVILRVFGSFFAGSSCKFVVEKALGYHAGLFVVETVNLYMTVVWLVFYLAARSKVQPQFGHRELEEFLDRVR